MKRLLLLPILCLMPAAQAIDYVKCEAMQKAATRLEVSMYEKANEARKAILKPAWKKFWSECSNEFSGNSKKALKCAETKIAPYKAEGNAARDAVLSTYAARIAQVKSDYEAEGCY